MGFTLRETVWLNGAPVAGIADDTAYFVRGPAGYAAGDY